MQRPTITGIRVRTPSDAHAIFHAVSLKMLPIVSRRLDTEERRLIASGCVFVWEERGPNAESSCQLGIERWTDSIRWGPSRVKDEFLYYQEKGPESTEMEMTSDSDTAVYSPTDSNRAVFRDNLIKQTYSVFVETNRGRRKWHLIAYFTQESLNYLRTIDDISVLSNLYVPPGKYTSARSAKGRPRDGNACDPYVLRNYPRSGGAQPSPSGWQDTGIIHPYGRDSVKPRAGSGRLAPLAYLENIPPPRRHPADEEALNALGFR